MEGLSDLFTWLVSIYNLMFSRTADTDFHPRWFWDEKLDFDPISLNRKYNFSSVCTLKINFLFSKAAVLKSTIYLNMYLNCILNTVGLQHVPGSFSNKK